MLSETGAFIFLTPVFYKFNKLCFNFPLPSFENEKYLQNRYEISKQICESTNIYDARGTVDMLTRRLKK